MRRLSLLLLLTAACGQAAPPEPVTPGISTTGTGVSVDLSGTAEFGVAGTSP